MDAPAPDPPRLARLAVLFPLAVFAAATFFLLGDLGKWVDDWYYIQRDPATGEVQSLYLNKPIHFFRPLFRATVPSLQTLLWRDDWALHLINALAHAVATALLWRLFVSIGFTRLAAAVGAMLFAFYPVHFEVVFWAGALPTSLSLSTTLLALHLGLRHARGQAGAWVIPAIGFTAFAAASFNEQAPLLIAALPFLGVAIRPDGAPVARALMRSLAPAAAAGLCLVVYLLIHGALSLPRPTVGEKAILASPERMVEALPRFLYWLRARHFLHDFSRPAFAEGVRTIASRPVTTLAFAALIVAGIASWVARHRADGDERPAAPSRLPRVLPLLAAAATMLAAAWSPVVVFTYWMMPRLAYAPTVGLALLLALCLDVASRHTVRRPRLAGNWRTGVAIAAAIVSLAFTVMMIGAQSMFRQRARLDLAQVGALRAMVPAPPPGSVFTPTRIAVPPGRPHAAGFDGWFLAALNSPWSARWIVRFAYTRNDLEAGFAFGHESGVVRILPDAAGVGVRGIGPTPWDRIIPFEIDERGSVRLITRIVMETAAGTRTEFDVPQVSALDPDALERAGFHRPGSFVHRSP